MTFCLRVSAATLKWAPESAAFSRNECVASGSFVTKSSLVDFGAWPPPPQPLDEPPFCIENEYESSEEAGTWSAGTEPFPL